MSTSSKYHPEKSAKYAYFDEVKEMYRKGKSLVIYQHATRMDSPSEQSKKRKRQISKILKVSPENIKTVFFSTGTSRFYLIIQQPAHKEVMDANLYALMNTPWKRILELK